MLIIQHSLYVSFDKHYKICLFMQKATNNLELLQYDLYQKSIKFSR